MYVYMIKWFYGESFAVHTLFQTNQDSVNQNVCVNNCQYLGVAA